ncbi:helix-turn-helix domain-containing protein [Butyrivibrio sp. AE3004]|uniref:helix-turn-helix domain-containing protein n=1 Tax=Butyrivibrio sp. AE3004 TaxID=1506994 RepID=UPI0004949488|nr:helix-turn-helix transcriptional regulator [Butyrivibrio sp. AE3004]
MNDKIIALFEEKKINKRQLAKLSGLQYTTVNEILNRKQQINSCSGRTLMKLAAFFDVHIEELLDPFPILENVEGRYNEVDYIWRDAGDNMELVVEVDGETYHRVMERSYIIPENFKYAPIFAKMEIDLLLEELEIRKLAEEFKNGKISSET